ncbi:unnamed protein product [Linum tenue]|uniref:Uncharacterized protein n=1 Tax=Linum tenue TaxID=586396 RepID=A0AAV0NHA2_9ROSI|nr:unnamed protein product [Linum tenue]
MESEFGWGHSTARRLRRWRMTRRHFRCGEPGRYSISRWKRWRSRWRTSIATSGRRWRRKGARR